MTREKAEERLADARLPMPRDASPFAQAQALRKRAAELRAEAARLDLQAAFLTLGAHKARKARRAP